MKHWIKRVLDRSGYALFPKRNHYPGDGLCTLHSDHFRCDPRFQAAYARGVQASAGVDPQFEWRVHVALWAASVGARMDGDFVECGVNAGFISSAILRYLPWNDAARRFYLIDTFAGPVLEQFSAEEARGGRIEIAKEAIAAGAYVTDIDRVRRNFAEWPQAEIVQGRIPDVFETITCESVAFVHVDLNCAAPEKAALEFFWPRLSRGGVVLLDDYAYFGCSSQTAAIDAFAAHVGAQVLSLPTGQGLMVK